MKNHIVFLLGGWDIGGVERITGILADAFAKLGWRVTITAFTFGRRDLLDGVDARVEICELSCPVHKKENIEKLRTHFHSDEKIFFINNWALPFGTTRFIRKVLKGFNAKLISCIHNIPNTNGRIAGARNPLVRQLWKWVSGINMHLVYHFSDAYVLLSKSFEPIFRRFAYLPFTNKLYSISCPLTIKASENDNRKEKSILYLGRLEEKQKCVSRVFGIWERIMNLLPDWRLDVVGDGPDRVMYEQMAKGLARVTFHGFQKPRPYYENSKLLILTSDFEGFGLVNIEAMSARCIPIVYGSYSSVYDIIDPDVDGMILPTPYDEAKFCDRILSLVKDEKKLEKMALRAEAKSKTFTLDAIMSKWLNLFRKLEKEMT